MAYLLASVRTVQIMLRNKSCNYGIFIGQCPYRPSVACIHTCRTCYSSRFTATLFQSSEHIGVLMAPTRISYHVFPRIRTSNEGWKCVAGFLVCIFLNRPIITETYCALCHLCTSNNLLSRHDNTGKNCVPYWWWYVSRKLNISEHNAVYSFLLFSVRKMLNVCCSEQMVYIGTIHGTSKKSISIV